MVAKSNSFWKRPRTYPGWWAVGLAALFVVMIILNATIFMRLSENTPLQLSLLPFYGIFMMLCGLAAGVIALIAILRNHERSWLVWLTLIPGVFTLLIILGEFLVPH